MRILFVAMPNSIHTCRWVNQLADQGWDVHLYPSTDGGIHPDLKNLTVHQLIYRRPHGLSKTVKVRGLRWPSERYELVGRMAMNSMVRMVLRVRSEDQPVHFLARTIRRIKPDIVHSLEIQHAGYMTYDARALLAGGLPTWIATNWGSDIFLFGRLPEHIARIRQVLAACDYYSCECERDVAMAREMGLRGDVLPVLPSTGGFDLVRGAELRQPGPPSARRLILLKGYQNWAGRALVGLRAMALAADALRGRYRLGVYLANNDVRIAAELLAQSAGIAVEQIGRCSHDEMLRLFGQARVHIGLGISDAISTTLLEAMVMGALPIQSCTACADEWIVDGESGLIVPPEDPEPIAAAIRRAVSDDALVDRAAEMNAQVARERLDQEIIRPQVVAMYERIAAGVEEKRKPSPA